MHSKTLFPIAIINTLIELLELSYDHTQQVFDEQLFLVGLTTFQKIESDSLNPLYAITLISHLKQTNIEPLYLEIEQNKDRLCDLTFARRQLLRCFVQNKLFLSHDDAPPQLIRFTLPLFSSETISFCLPNPLQPIKTPS